MALSCARAPRRYLIGAIPVGFPRGPRRGRHRTSADRAAALSGHQRPADARTGPAVLTLVGDIVKGYLAVRVALAIGPEAWTAAGGAVAAIVGNCWPVFLRFRGGKVSPPGSAAFLALIRGRWARRPCSGSRSPRCLATCPWPPWWRASACRGRAAARLSAPLGHRGGGGCAYHRVAPPGEHRAPDQRHPSDGSASAPASREPSEPTRAMLGAGRWPCSAPGAGAPRSRCTWAARACRCVCGRAMRPSAASWARGVRHPRYLPGVKLPDGVTVTAEVAHRRKVEARASSILFAHAPYGTQAQGQ